MHTKLFFKVEYCLLFLLCCSGKMFYLNVALVFLITVTTTEFVIIRFLIMLIHLFLSTYY